MNCNKDDWFKQCHPCREKREESLKSNPAESKFFRLSLFKRKNKSNRVYNYYFKYYFMALGEAQLVSSLYTPQRLGSIAQKLNDTNRLSAKNARKHMKTRENMRKTRKNARKTRKIARQSSEKHAKRPTKTRKTSEKHTIPATFTRITS